VQSADVVIVGAGPAGSAAALRIARQGFDVLLVDQARFPRDKPCGEYLNPAAVAALRRLGLVDALLEAGARSVAGVRLVSPAGRALQVPYPPRGADPVWGLSVPRLALDDTLLRAAGAAGARVREGFRVDDLLTRGPRVTGIVGRSDHGAETVRARLVLAADGTRSVIARRLRLTRAPSAPHRLGLVAHYEGVEGAGWVEMHAGRRGYCGLGYSAEGGANVAMVAEPEDLPQIRGRAEVFYEERLAQFPAIARRLKTGQRTGRLMVTGSMSAKVSLVAAPGLLLLGDAAGFYDPFTGEGISYALRGAELAAAAAAAALSPSCLRGSNRHAPAEATAFHAYAAQRRAEFGSRVLVSRVIQALLARPAALEAVFRRFEADLTLAQRLIGVTAGVLPPRVVMTPDYLVRLLLPVSGVQAFRRSGSVPYAAHP
jgi:geranylgeranyl reductase family protein